MPEEPFDQQIRELGRKDDRLLQAIIEVGHERHCVPLDVRQHLHRHRPEPHLSIPVGRSTVAIDGAEVALTVDHRVAQREVLDHAHECVVDGHVTVRVILAQNLTDYRGALLVRPVGRQPQLVHRVEHPAMHRLQPVADIWKGPLHDYAHRIVDEGLPHLVFEIPG